MASLNLFHFFLYPKWNHKERKDIHLSSWCSYCKCILTEIYITLQYILSISITTISISYPFTSFTSLNEEKAFLSRLTSFHWLCSFVNYGIVWREDLDLILIYIATQHFLFYKRTWTIFMNVHAVYWTYLKLVNELIVLKYLHSF